MLYEVCTYGKQPYKGMKPKQIYEYLDDGNRLVLGDMIITNTNTKINTNTNTRRKCQELLDQCCALEASERPTFDQIIEKLKGIANSSKAKQSIKKLLENNR